MARGLKSLGSSPPFFVNERWDVRRLWQLGHVRSEKNRPDLGLLSVFLGRGVISYREGGGQVHKPSLDLGGYQAVHPGDLVLNNQQAWRGSVGVSDQLGIVSPAYVVFALNGALHPRFANHLLQSDVMVAQFVTVSKGVGDIQRDVHVPWLKNARVPVPSWDEQRSIVRFLDHADRRIGCYIRAKQKLIGLLEEQKQAIMYGAVTRGLDPDVRVKPSGIEGLGVVPEHWQVMLNQRIFKEEVRPHGGRTETQLSLSQRDGLIPSSEMKERSLQTSTYDNWKVTVPGDLVLNRFKAHLGVFFASTLRGIVSFHYGVFAPRRPLNTKYFELLYHTVTYRDLYAGRSNGMTVGLQNLSNQNFYAVHAIVPPLEEQNEIVGFVESAGRGRTVVAERLRRDVGLLREFRTRLIADVVTGRLDVREAAARLPDEAAEEASGTEAGAEAEELTDEGAGDDDAVEPIEEGE